MLISNGTTVSVKAIGEARLQFGAKYLEIVEI